ASHLGQRPAVRGIQRVRVEVILDDVPPRGILLRFGQNPVQLHKQGILALNLSDAPCHCSVSSFPKEWKGWGAEAPRLLRQRASPESPCCGDLRRTCCRTGPPAPTPHRGRPTPRGPSLPS